MPIARALMSALVVAFVVLISALSDDRATQRVVTVTVREFRANESMSVANGFADPSFQIALRETTAYEGSPADIKPGVRVTVSYRNVGERRPVADRVRVLVDAATR